VVEETPTIRTILFKDEYCIKAEPGQFAMVWIPNVDEIPMSLSLSDHPEYCAFTVKIVGEATTALFSIKARGLMGVRGPYGRSFTAHTGHILVIGGGTGLAPLVLLCGRMKHLFEEVTVVIGAKSKSEVLFEEKFRRVLKDVSSKVIVTTDDGSYGIHGLIPDAVKKIVDDCKIDMIYVCGPEHMIAKVFHLAEERGIEVQASLERIMKCGVGLCGSCCIGKYILCTDGPVFTSSKLKEVSKELGSFKMDASGRFVEI